MTVQKELLKAWRRLTAGRNRLTLLANRYGSDKGDRRHQRHQYTRIYEPLFRGLRNQPIRLLEIGLLNSRNYASWTRREQRYAGTAAGSRAPSLEMWSRYFPKATIFGFDINDFSNVQLPHCTIVQGDMGSRADLQRVVDRTGGAFDIVIDDASHASHHQQIALGFLFPHVAAGGLYIVEDLQWQPAAMEPPDAMKTRDLLRVLAVTGKFPSPFLAPAELAALEHDTLSVRLYDSLVANDALDADDALAIIRKRSV